MSVTLLVILISHTKLECDLLGLGLVLGCARNLQAHEGKPWPFENRQEGAPCCRGATWPNQFYVLVDKVEVIGVGGEFHGSPCVTEHT